MEPNSTLFLKREIRRAQIERKEKIQAEQSDEPKLSQSQAKKCADRRKGRAEHISRENQS